MNIRALTVNDVPAIFRLISQTPTYFGHRVDHRALANILGGLIQNRTQTLWGAFENGSLLSMLGQRMVQHSPTWVENFVYLDKQTTRLYNLKSTGFLDLLAHAIQVAESQHRYSFMTAFVLKELPTRLRVTQRHLPTDHPLRQYVPSVWYQEGEFLDAYYMLGATKEKPPDGTCGVLQWTKPLTLVNF